MRTASLTLSSFVCALFTLSLPFTTSAESVIPQEFRFTETLKRGSHGSDVFYLQVLLNKDAETQVNTPGLLGGAGNETDFLGGATKQAIIRFQNKYGGDVLRPAGLAKGNGIVGPLTRAKLNSLLETARHETLRTEAAPVVVTVTLPSETSTAVATATPALSSEELNTSARAALVNILCTTKRGGSFSPISGSGVFIDTRGVILTNAHIGQYFLLKEYLARDFIDCVVRSGEPARNKYRATLLYLSPPWVDQNASKLTADEATSTGENDFALLLVTESTNPEVPLPHVFPTLPVQFDDRIIQVGNEALAAGYPAGFLSGITIQRDLYPSSSVVAIGNVFSFHEQTADIFSIGGSVVAQQGSSGGAVVSPTGSLIGLIVTSSKAKATGDRNLNALTMSHLERSFSADTGKSLSLFFTEDVAQNARLFNKDVAPLLKQKLVHILTRQ